MPRKPKESPVSRLLAAMDACAIARGEAQWTNGYRTAKGTTHEATPDGIRLYEKELAQWRVVGESEAAFQRLARRIVREARATPEPRAR